MEENNQFELHETQETFLTDEPRIIERLDEDEPKKSTETRLQKESRFGWRDIVLLVGYFPVQIIITFLVTFIFIFIRIASGTMGMIDIDAPEMLAASTWGLFISGFAMALYVIIAYKEFLKDQWQKFTKHLGKNIGLIVLSYVGAIAFMALFSTFISDDTSGNQELIESMFENAGTLEYFLLMAPTVLFAPLVEEMLFRKIFVGNVLAKKKPLLTIGMALLSSVLFGLLHFSGLSAHEILLLVPYMGMGLSFAIVYIISGNFFTAFGGHLLNNFIAVLVMIFVL